MEPQKYACRYGERLVFIKKVKVDVCGYEAYVYLCIDEDMYLMQHKKAMLNALDDKKDSDETDAAIKRLGAFARHLLVCFMATAIICFSCHVSFVKETPQGKSCLYGPTGVCRRLSRMQ